MKICHEHKQIEDMQLSFLMSSILRMRHEFYKEELNEINIKWGEFPFLMLLYLEGNKTQKEITDIFYFTQSNTAKFIRKLEDKQLIERKINAKNRREKIVSLTQKGNDKCQKMIELEKKWEKRITKNITDEEYSNIKENLHKILLDIKEDINCDNP